MPLRATKKWACRQNAYLYTGMYVWHLMYVLLARVFPHIENNGKVSTLSITYNTLDLKYDFHVWIRKLGIELRPRSLFSTSIPYQVSLFFMNFVVRTLTPFIHKIYSLILVRHRYFLDQYWMLYINSKTNTNWNTFFLSKAWNQSPILFFNIIT